MREIGGGLTKLLIAYDGSGYAHGALRELRSSGLPHNAQVIIISVSEIFLPLRDPALANPPDEEVVEYFRKHQEQVERNLEETETDTREARKELIRYFPEWIIDIEVVSGSPALEILKTAERFKPDIIVVAERGLSSDQPIGLGSISQTVLSEAKCTVRIARLQSREVNSQPRIIIGFDGSHESVAAVKSVARRAWKTKPEIRLVIVTDPFSLLKPGRAFDPIPGMSEGTMAGEEKWVEMLAAGALPLLRDSGLSATVNSYSGNPRMILIREAQTWDADAMFLGATSSTNLPKLYSLGCAASAVANRATCSVEVVRENTEDLNRNS